MMSEPKARRWVGKYELGRMIAECSFGKVRSAVDTQTGDPVALMILHKDKVLKHKMAEQVIRISILASSFFLCLLSSPL